VLLDEPKNVGLASHFSVMNRPEEPALAVQIGHEILPDIHDNV
jgi:hypothetical protein